ncbi:MAG TPA: DHH family phosphoesterase, partial [Oscillatoriaceae cyanobacterium]
MSAPATRADAGFAQEVSSEAAAWLGIFREVGAWLVVPHMSPDADTLGSALGMAALLRRLGRRVAVACADSVARYDYLPGADQVLVGRLPEDWPADAGVVTLDAAEFDRLGCMGPLIADMRPFVNIDHHISNQRFGSHNWIDVASAATGEMVALLYDYFGVPLEREAATDLYAAIVTDTGFFRYPATTARTLEVASALVATGIDF